jgi:hypothetical protein
MSRISTVAAAGAAFTIALASTASAQQQAPATDVGRGRVSTFRLDSLKGAPQGFSVALVLGDMAATPAQDNVPPAARKALTDMKDFLPFKTYRLLDAQWTLCCGRSPVATRLRGVDEHEYELELTPGRTDVEGKWYVHFVLRDAGTGDQSARTMATESEVEAIAQQRRQLESRLTDLRSRYNEDHPEVAKARAEERQLAQRLRELQLKAIGGRRVTTAAGRSRTVIDTSFTMDVGETVVVGTSRVRGADKALIALLTAVPPRSSTAK